MIAIFGLFLFLLASALRAHLASIHICSRPATSNTQLRPIKYISTALRIANEDIAATLSRRNMSSTDVVANGHSHDFEYGYTEDHVLRPRPRKPLHAQVSHLSAASSTDGDSQHLNLPGENGAGSATTR